MPNSNGLGTNESPPNKHDHLVTAVCKQNFPVSASSAKGTEFLPHLYLKGELSEHQTYLVTFKEKAYKKWHFLSCCLDSNQKKATAPRVHILRQPLEIQGYLNP